LTDRNEHLGLLNTFAGSIVEVAMEENCDTIVFGRKGKSEASSFNIGRVPWKVIHGAKEMTVGMVP
jgi:hypothetical protein